MLDPIVFFSVLVVLQILDAWTTYIGLKLSSGGVKEANPVLRGLFKKIGVKESLFLVKAGLLAYLWFHPVANQTEQIILIVGYVAVVANNWRIVKKLKDSK
jgi:hypothetical protein